MRGALGSRLASAPTTALLRALGRRVATVFMLHRFRDPQLGNEGDDVAGLREVLERLRRQQVRLMGLRELLRHVREREPLTGPTIVFTVDDGYLDFASVAAPVLAEYDCPVTVFVTTEVTAGRLWFWWDRIEQAFIDSPLPTAEFDVGGRPWRISLGSPAQRREEAERLTERAKWLDQPERLALVATIAERLGVSLPDRPPVARRVLGWDEIRALEKRGVSFGPHSRHHPIMSRVDDATARDEIEGSWATLRAECADPVPVFCYPNGTRESFTLRDERLTQQAGLDAAVAFEPGRVDVRSYPSDALFRLPRASWTGDPLVTAVTASGLYPLR